MPRTGFCRREGAESGCFIRRDFRRAALALPRGMFFSSFGFFCWIIERDPRVRILEGRGSATDLELCKVTVVPPQNMIEKEIDHVQKFFYGVSREDSDR